MNYKNIVVAGGGVLGSQIAFQTAYCGFNVTIWLRSESSVKRCQVKIDSLRDQYIADIERMATDKTFEAIGISTQAEFNKEECLKKVEEAYKNLKLIVDKKEAYKDADLVIESMSEIEKDKIAYYQDVAQYLPEKTVIVTNSSTLLPSTFAKYTKRPGKYLSLHFANHIWRQNTAEVMTSPYTDKKYFDEVIEFANAIRMVALPVLKEKSGYLLNSMLVPFLLSGLDLYANGVGTPESIDIAWKNSTGAPRGPFEIFDLVGIETAYNIVCQYLKVPGLISPLLKKMMMPYNFKAQAKILKGMLDKGETGVASGKGFYTYKK